MHALYARITAFFRSRIFRVGIIGITGLAIQTSVFELLGIYLKLIPPSSAVIVGGEVSILCIFFLNQRFAFGDKKESGSMIARLLKFHLVIAGSLFLQWLLTFIAEHLTDNVLIIHAAYLCGVGLGFITNYLGYSLFVFRSSAGDRQRPSGQTAFPKTDTEAGQ